MFKISSKINFITSTTTRKVGIRWVEFSALANFDEDSIRK